MGWKEEKNIVPRTDKATRGERYVKEELMRYYWYIDKYIDIEIQLNEFKNQYRDYLDDPPTGGSVIKLPDGINDNSNPIIKLEGKLYDIKMNLEYYENKLNTLDAWLGCLTEAQRAIIKTYVCVNISAWELRVLPKR